jgi:polyisoprenoid-binding protein YceI
VISKIRKHWKFWLGGALVAVLALGIGVPYFYIHVVEGNQPAALSLEDALQSGSATTPAVSAAGTWNMAANSQAGYRVHEILAGQSMTAVGRTSAITGNLAVAGTTVNSATFTVDMTKMASDRSQRDAQFQGRIMETSIHPTATFTLTDPFDLGSTASTGKKMSKQVVGKFTLHGTTKTVKITITALQTGSAIALSGTIPIAFTDYRISSPSYGDFVKVGNIGVAEFLLKLNKA